MYPSSTVTARNLNQATAPKLKQGPLHLAGVTRNWDPIHSDHKIGVALHHTFMFQYNAKYIRQFRVACRFTSKQTSMTQKMTQPIPLISPGV
ncbi:unnamed protein product [Phytophthora fragariaefolia]|uniref:Unnamed protein product n=1 Tax=Phytophthora fragariaefolia TaxID=1490495 RepID=A0A9W7D1Y9_9STRA|nr:unnamed protein product [Phytophthora fragariaefolia]